MTIIEPSIADDARLSISQAAILIDLSRQTLYRAIKAGELKTGIRRSNRRPFIFGKELKRFWRASF